MPEPTQPASGDEVTALQAETARLKKIIQALMDHAESSTSARNTDFSLFQSTIVLEGQVSRRTADLEAALRENEKINRALQQSKKQMELEIQERKNVEAQLVHKAALAAELHVLQGLLPICSSCKKIRDDHGYWNRLEDYINQHSEATFTHGICPDCVRKFFPDIPTPGEPDDASQQ